ncbi:MAG TPA: hypothetical protein VN258_06580 [Mobilitalea sp.]|nr:hypothetical protein [Mobilitalea sp.]
MPMDDTFSFEDFSLVNIKTGEYTPVDKNGKPIIESDSQSNQPQNTTIYTKFL